MMTSKQKYNVAVTAAALQLIESPGMTTEKLRNLREAELQSGGIQDEVDRMYYDALMAAIEIMERPLFM
jgi:hypothetical protein